MLTLAASLLAVLAIRAVAVELADVDPSSDFEPLQAQSVGVFTALGVAGAVLTCTLLNRWARQPVAAFRRIAAIALVISWIPDVGVWVGDAYPDTRAATVLPLMLMHLTVASICLLVLPKLGVDRS